MRILVSYRGIPQSPGWATGDFVVKAFRDLGHECEPYAKFYQRHLWVENQNQYDDEYDLLLYLECNDGDPQYTELSSVRARKTACWLFDTSYYPDHLVGLQNQFKFDVQFIANPLDVDRFSHSFHMPYACDPRLHFRSLQSLPGTAPSVPQTCQVALIGSDRKDRRALQQELGKSGVDLDLVSGVFREQYIDALAASEFVINQNPDAGAGLFNMRQFEAPAAGSIIFTEGRDYDANEGEFEHMVNCVVYRNTDDIVRYICDLESDPDRKEKLRSTGQSHVLQHHTYEARCKEILELTFPHEAL